MPRSEISIPFPQDLYDDIVRFSDGTIDPVSLVESQVRAFIVTSIEVGWDGVDWGSRLEDIAQKYAPETLARWRKQEAFGSDARTADKKPLIWKEVEIPAGSEVRMSYGDTQHYAMVRGGHIVDDGREYSPSEWASKVAGGTSRNAWRDLWFKYPGAHKWIRAQILRDQEVDYLNNLSPDDV